VSLEAPQRGRYRVVLGYVFRGIYAAIWIIINYAIFFLVPSLIYGFIGQLTPDLETIIIGFFVVIEVLTVMRIMLENHMLGTISAAGLGLVQAVYIYTVSHGGTFFISLNGFSITAEFKLLVYLMMTIPLLGTVKQVYYMVNKSSAQPIKMMEAAG
jgi:hypothetical protein